MEELAVSMSLSVPELKMSPVEPSTMNRIMLPPSEPMRRLEELLRLPETLRAEPIVEDPNPVRLPTTRSVPDVNVFPVPPSTKKYPVAPPPEPTKRLEEAVRLPETLS